MAKFKQNIVQLSLGDICLQSTLPCQRKDISKCSIAAKTGFPFHKRHLFLSSVRRRGQWRSVESRMDKKEEEDTFDERDFPDREWASETPFAPSLAYRRALGAPRSCPFALVAKFSVYVSMMSNKMPPSWPASKHVQPPFPVQCHAEKTVKLLKCSQYHPW